MKKTILILCILMLSAGAVLGAAWKGRLVGKVLDPEGNVLEGVKVTATCGAIEDYREEAVSNKRGVFKITFPQLNHVYELVFEKEGFTTYKHQLDWKVDGTANETFTLEPGTDGEPPASASQEAIQAFNEGVRAFGGGDMEEAGDRFSTAVEHDAELHQAWSALARVRQNQGRFEEAAAAAETAIGLGSDDPVVFRTRWEAYRDLGDEDKAAEALATFEDTALRKDEAKKLYNQALKLKQQGDLEEAFEKYRAATDLDPKLKPAWLAVATTGMELGEHAAAADAADAILNLEPGDETAVRLRYNACLELGDDNRLFEAMAGLAPFEAEVAKQGMLTLAFGSYDRGELEVAVSRFGKVLEVDPLQPRAHYYLGLIKLDVATAAEARPHLEQVLELVPGTREAAVAAELLKSLE